MKDDRPASQIGRHARLELRFSCRRGRTVLAHAYAEPPYRIGRSFDVDGALYLIVACTGPGIFAGDDLHQFVIVERRARVLLASQAALQVHPSGARRPARVAHRYLVEADGELHCHWDPIIPFADAHLAQRFDLQIVESGRLYWSDALMSGRCSRGEAWAFRRLVHELRLSTGGSLQYLERYELGDPPRSELKPRPIPVLSGGAHYIGTTLIHHDALTAAFAEELQRRMDGIAGIRAGVDLVERRLVVGRILGTGGPPFAAARAAFRDHALAAVFKAPQLVVRR